MKSPFGSMVLLRPMKQCCRYRWASANAAWPTWSSWPCTRITTVEPSLTRKVPLAAGPSTVRLSGLYDRQSPFDGFGVWVVAGGFGVGVDVVLGVTLGVPLGAVLGCCVPSAPEPVGFEGPEHPAVSAIRQATAGSTVFVRDMSGDVTAVDATRQSGRRHWVGGHIAWSGAPVPHRRGG